MSQLEAIDPSLSHLCGLRISVIFMGGETVEAERLGQVNGYKLAVATCVACSHSKISDQNQAPKYGPTYLKVHLKMTKCKCIILRTISKSL